MIKHSLYSTAEVAALAGVHRDTLLRWLREGKVQEPARDARGWRSFTQEEASLIASYLHGETTVQTTPLEDDLFFAQGINKLEYLDWNFVGAKTDYLTHGIHPYPAKYIPQIPNALIQELSSVEETVADVFCGSGTTLVEALTLKRHAVGVDANPLACLISSAKTTILSTDAFESLSILLEKALKFSEDVSVKDPNSLFNTTPYKSPAPRPPGHSLHDWFDSQVIEELAEILAWCNALCDTEAKTIAKVAFSAIVVSVSRQDSDTRYVRRIKNVQPGDVFRRFARSLQNAVQGVIEYTKIAERRFKRKIINASVLDRPEMGALDAIVCSPPYPNAWSYHLYHRTRMLWLALDQPKFKNEEIGSHRKYSRKQPTDKKVSLFRHEMECLFDWISRYLKRGRYAAFVIGDSIIDGILVSNADVLSETSAKYGFRETARINREIQATKKAFNPSIGKIKQEQILILQNSRGPVA